MELHQLRYFVAVAELGSFTEAARRCSVAQPSLSQQVIKLEKTLGEPLFERLGRVIRLTEAGKVLYPQAVSILDTAEKIPEKVTRASDPLKGTLRLGAIPTIAPYFLPPILKQFSAAFSQASILLTENLTEHTVRACLQGDIDLGVIASPIQHHMLQSEPLFTEDLLLALPPKHPLLEKAAIRIADMSDEPFVVLSEMHCLGEQVLGFCKQQGISPAVRCESTQLLTVQELVASGHGISLVPAMATQMDRGKNCEYRLIADAKPTRTIIAIWHKNRQQNLLFTKFLEQLRNNVCA